jgi:alkanesulfonate monooxygenase SsuD/methylene tetrahydromethanopterin reductase-like flavin-dependent oxidoreductase (luciferase family)
MGRVQFGWSMPRGAVTQEGRGAFTADMEQAFALIRGQFDSAWLIDHLQFGDADLLEGWTGLTYWAARQPDFQFGHGVLCQSFRNPALLAKMGATLQFLTGGRFILGLGAGWHEEEYRAYGYDFPPPGVRVAQTEETVAIIKAMWQEPRATFEGKYYRVVEAYCEPKPEPVPPLVIGGRQPRMLRLIARHADWWDVSGFGVGIDVYREAAAEMDRACAEVGRDPATLRRTFSAPVVCAAGEETARTLAEGRLRPGAGFIGTPEQVVTQMRRFTALGVDHFQLMCLRTEDHASLDRVIGEVIPALNE